MKLTIFSTMGAQVLFCFTAFLMIFLSLTIFSTMGTQGHKCPEQDVKTLLSLLQKKIESLDDAPEKCKLGKEKGA